MRKLDASTGKLSSDDTTLYSLATRPGTAIEAPSIVHRGPYYYLFASIDFCCRGANSTYKVIVGRSKQITGPYFDMQGVPMMQGGGTLLLEGTTQLRGPGGQSVLLGDSGDVMVFHAYDGVTGASSLQLSTITWENGWPRTGTLPGYPAAVISSGGVVNAADFKSPVSPEPW